VSVVWVKPTQTIET